MNLHVLGNHGKEARIYEWGKVDKLNLEYKMNGLGKIKMYILLSVIKAHFN